MLPRNLILSGRLRQFYYRDLPISIAPVGRSGSKFAGLALAGDKE